MSFTEKRNKGEKKAKTIRIPTPAYLANVALAYLGRYAATEASFRRVLENRLRRAAMQNAVFAADRAAQKALREAIEKLVEKYKTAGVLNDAAYAEMKIGSLRRSGGSARRISQKLQVKGVKAPIIAAAFEEEVEREGEGRERKAALLFAKKKGLGPYRKEGARKKLDEAAQKKKDIAAFLRAGFSYDLVKEVLGADPEDVDFEV
jgi:regulatory protein